MTWAEKAWNEEFAALGWRMAGQDANGRYNYLEIDVPIKHSIGAIVSGTICLLEPDEDTWKLEISMPWYSELWRAAKGDLQARSTLQMEDHAGDGGEIPSWEGPFETIHDLIKLAEAYIRGADLRAIYANQRSIMRHF